MVLYSGVVTVRAIPRDCVEAIVASLHDCFERLPVDDKGRLLIPADAPGESSADAAGPEHDPALVYEAAVRHTRGEHLAPGARYLLTGGQNVTEATLIAWDRSAETRISVRSGTEVAETPQDVAGSHAVPAPPPADSPADRHGQPVDESSEPDLSRPYTFTATVVLGSAQAPKLLTATGQYQGLGRWRCINRGWGSVRLDLDRWWQQEQAPAPQFVAVASHPWAEARAALTLLARDEEYWTVRITISLRGRWWARPLVAAGMRVANRRLGLRDRYRDALAQFAEDWNKAAGEGFLADESAAWGAASEVDWRDLRDVIADRAVQGGAPWALLDMLCQSWEAEGRHWQEQMQALDAEIRLLPPWEYAEVVLTAFAHRLPPRY